MSTSLQRSLVACALLATITSIAAQRISPKQNSTVVARAPKPLQSDGTTEAGVPVAITIEHFQYNGGAPVTVKAGQSVVWINRDPMQHTASADGDDQAFDTGLLQPGQQSDPVVFQTETAATGIQYHCNVHDGMQGTIIVSGHVAPVDPIANGIAHESPSVHSMVAVGGDVMFLHHVALFNDFNHQYQVTLEAELADSQARAAFIKACPSKSGQLCVLDPEYFKLGELNSGARKTFTAKFFQGAWDVPISGLEKAEVRIRRVVEYRHYDPSDRYPTELRYRLVGSGSDIYLINEVSEAPNFQQVVHMSGDSAVFSASVLARTPVVTVIGKSLSAAPPRSLKTAVLSNTSHILLSPPPGTLNPQEPFRTGENITIRIDGDAVPRTLRVEQPIFFDVRILNK